MHIILGILAVAGAAYFWLWRVRNAADMASELADAARDVRLAARRFGFRRKSNVHPADAIDDARIAASGILGAIARLAGTQTDAQRVARIVQMQSVFDVSRDGAGELALLGDWMADQCGTPSAAVSRLARRLKVLAGPEAAPDMLRMIDRIFSDGDGTPNEDVAAARADVARLLGS